MMYIQVPKTRVRSWLILFAEVIVSQILSSVESSFVINYSLFPGIHVDVESYIQLLMFVLFSKQETRKRNSLFDHEMLSRPSSNGSRKISHQSQRSKQTADRGISGTSTGSL